MKYIFFIIAGFIGGTLGGMGMGGGTLLIPLLTLFGGVKQHTAQAVNLMAFIPASIVALTVHVSKKNVQKSVLLPIVMPAFVTSLIGSLCATLVNGRLLSRLFGGFLILLSVYVIYQAIKGEKGLKKIKISKKRKAND